MQNSAELKPVDLREVETAARNCHCRAVYLHWTAGRYGQVFPEYHISIDKDGRIYFPDDCANFDVTREHTWCRNTGAIGVALCGCFDAVANGGPDCDMGTNPVTGAQIEVLAAVVATICSATGIPLTDVKTHCEVAYEDDYGPGSGDPETKWDLWFLPDTDGKIKPGGYVIRGKAAWYMREWRK